MSHNDDVIFQIGAKLLKSSGATIYAIGVGSPCRAGASRQARCYQPGELAEIATSPEYIFEIDSFDKLASKQ